jgi:hypothetical protein
MKSTLIFLAALHTAEAASKKTNIVVNPFNDLGYEDIGKFGPEKKKYIMNSKIKKVYANRSNQQ